MAEVLPPRRGRLWRALLIVLALLVLLPAAAIAVLLSQFDPNDYKPRIEAAVQQATGRQLSLRGPIRLKFALVPTLTVDDASFANMPGGSRPEMARIERLEVSLALLPLLSRQVEVAQVTLVKPDILLERDAGGRANWQFGQAAAPQPAQPQQQPQTQQQGGGSFAIRRLTITDGVVTWRDAQAGRSRVVAVQSLAARTAPGEPVSVDARLAIDALALTAEARFGTPEMVASASAAAPFPLRLSLQTEGASLSLDGSIAEPRAGRGWRFAVQAAVADLARFAPLLPDVPLPALRDLRLSAQAADSGAAMPQIRELQLSLGETDLNALAPGLRLQRLQASLPSADQPLALQAEATSGTTPLRLAGQLGAPALLLPGAVRAPYPIDLTLQAGTATATLKGAIAEAARLAGVDLALSVRAPALAVLAPLAGMPLPALRDVALDARIAERGGGGFQGGAFLRDLRLSATGIDLGGELTFIIGQRRGLTGQLQGRRIDLDAIRAAGMAQPDGSISPPTAAAAPPAAPAPPNETPRADRRAIPDLPLPLGLLRVVDADLRLQVAELVAAGTTYRDVTAALAIQDGKARLDPLTLTLPGGHGELRAAADATTTPPTVQISAMTQQLDLGPLLTVLLPGQEHGSGRVDIDLDLRGRGADLRSVLGSAYGHFGVAGTEVRLPARMLEPLVAGMRRSLPQLAQLASQPVAVSCLAIRLNAQDGVARPQALAMETNLGRMSGDGAVNLRNETFQLRLQVDLRLPVPGLPAGLRVRAPVPLAGSWLAPRADFSAAGASAVGDQLERLGGNASPLGQILSGMAGGGAGGVAACPPLLAVARGGRPGPAPAAAEPAAEAPAPEAAPAPAPAPAPVPGPAEPHRQRPPSAQDLLRGLLRGR